MIRKASIKIVSVVAAIGALFAMFAALQVRPVEAASASGFNPGNIISDAVMGNYNSMTVDDIQRFLTEKGNCNNTNYALYQQLSAQYKVTKWHFENGHFICLSEERFGDGMVIGEGQTAAQIIYDAAQDYKINPQVLIVLLEKEQSLITDSYPNSFNYRSATGYGCPDTAACDTKYYGFKNQVRNAAAMFRTVLDGGWSNYPSGRTNYIQYHPNKDCGGTNVYIENRATSALYRYTPYQPNTAALNAGYGTGDSCSAYGNRNFYMLFTDWFGSTQARVEGEVIDIPEGEYGLTPKQANRYAIDVAAGGKLAGTNVHIWEKFDGAAQKWKFEKDDATGYYIITDINSGLALSMSTNTADAGTNVQLARINNSCSQKWRIYHTNDGYITLESMCTSGMVLDVSGGRSFNGANLQMWISMNNDAQKWEIYTGRVIDDGVYVINSMVNQNKDIQAFQDASVGGNDVRIHDDNGDILQKWNLSYSADGDYYVITHPITGLALDIQNGILSNGTNIRLWKNNGACTQHWKIIPRNDESYTLLSTCDMKMSLDLANSITTNGNNIRLWSYDDNAVGQRWKINREPLIKDGVYVIHSKLQNDKVIDLANSITTNGNNIRLWSYDDNAVGQRWKISYEEQTGYYILTELATGKALDVWTGNMRSGTNISLWEHYSTCAQKWSIIESDEGYYTFYSACQASRAIDVYNGLVENNTNIQLHEVNYSDAQKWSLIEYH